MIEVGFKNYKKQCNQGQCDLTEVQKQEIKKFKIFTTGIIYRNQSNYDLIFVSDKNMPEKGLIDQHEPLFSIKEQGSRFKITDIKKKSGMQEPLTQIVGYAHQTKHQFGPNLSLKQGDYIKIGRATIQIIKLNLGKESNQKSIYQTQQKLMMKRPKLITLQDYHFEEKKINMAQNQKNQSQMQNQTELTSNFSMISNAPFCKICYSKTIDQHNKLISLCKCDGSSKFIHQQCLKKWVQQKSCLQKLQKSSKEIYVALMKGFECQICKQLYHDNQFYEIIFSNNDSKLQKYIALSVKHNNQKQLYVINLDKTPQIKIGRQSDNDIIVHQLSCSRYHCVIQYVDKKLQILDLKSRFGTCLKTPSLVLEKKNKIIKMMKGRTYLEMQFFKDKQQKSIFKKFLMCYENIN